jgi:hypothetical protein
MMAPNLQNAINKSGGIRSTRLFSFFNARVLGTPAGGAAVGALVVPAVSEAKVVSGCLYVTRFCGSRTFCDQSTGCGRSVNQAATAYEISTQIHVVLLTVAGRAIVSRVSTSANPPMK